MFFQRLKTPGLGHNSYLLACGDGLAVVVDPRRDVDAYLRLARENDLTIVYVLETHRQEDFEFGSRTLAQTSGARIVSGSHALFGETDVKLEDGEELEVGTTRFVALETPGHTPESMSYAVYVEDAGDKCWGVFTGDTLFVGDTGRTDLPDPEKTGENAGILYDSVHRKIAPSATTRCSFRRTAPAPRAVATYRSATIPPWGSKKARTRCSARAAAISSRTSWPRKWRDRLISGIWRRSTCSPEDRSSARSPFRCYSPRHSSFG